MAVVEAPVAPVTKLSLVGLGADPPREIDPPLTSADHHVGRRGGIPGNHP